MEADMVHVLLISWWWREAGSSTLLRVLQEQWLQVESIKPIWVPHTSKDSKNNKRQRKWDGQQTIFKCCNWSCAHWKCTKTHLLIQEINYQMVVNVHSKYGKEKKIVMLPTTYCYFSLRKNCTKLVKPANTIMMGRLWFGLGIILIMSLTSNGWGIGQWRGTCTGGGWS